MKERKRETRGKRKRAEGSRGKILGAKRGLRPLFTLQREGKGTHGEKKNKKNLKDILAQP